MLNLLPVGVAQFISVIDDGYAFARSTAFYNDWTIALWLRSPGDVVFAAAGMLGCLRQLRHRRRPSVGEGKPVEPPAPVRAPRRVVV